MNRWKIKFVLVVVFILVIYLLLKIRDKEKDRQQLPLSIIQPKLEHFFDTPEPETLPGTLSETKLIEAFRIKHYKDAEKGSLFNLSSLVAGEEKSIEFESKKIKGKRFLLGPNGICFDSKNDDLLVLDVFRLRRFQCRDDRKIIDRPPVYPQLKFNLNDVKTNFKIGKQTIPLKNTEVIEKSVYYKKLFISYIDQIMETTLDKPSHKEILRTYKEALKKIDTTSKFPMSIEENKLENIIPGDKFQKKIYQNKTQLKSQIESLHNKYINLYWYPDSCSEVDNISCEIKYQYDIPPFILEKGRKGIHDLSYDTDPTTIYHPQKADLIIRPFNNDWNHYKKKGIFRPQIFDEDIDYSGTDDSGNLPSGRRNTINASGKLTETFANPDEGYVFLKAKAVNIALFNLTFELDNIGVNMYYNRFLNCVFVPDVMNNRIQIMECTRDDFFFRGQFGNLPYVSERSLPNYRNLQDKNIHFSKGLMYEPIVDTERYSRIKGYACSEENSINLQEFKKRGPFNPKTGNRNKRQNVYCGLTYNQDRFNIHSRNMLEKFQDTKEFVGHFGTLYTEYCRVNGIDINTGKITDNSKSLYFDNPHFISVNDDVGGKTIDGVTEASLAYKKLLFKNIKITNEGQKFGQLFRPKAIAFDDDYPDKNGKKYYVVDTYHHCIQCFNVKGQENTIDGPELQFESADINLNNDNQPYLYDEKMREGNRFATYSNSRMYSLGIRQKIIDSEDFKNPNSILTHHPEWALANGQHVNNKPKVMLYRWLSGTSGNGNIAYGGGVTQLNISYESLEDKFFYSGLCTSKKKKLNPGCGEFLFPSDILITKNPYTGEKLLMVADTGNNRVSIFKKYRIPNVNNEFRFRFYRFLYDSYPSSGTQELIYNPISLTCCENTGRIFVLNGNLGQQKILIFRPQYDDNKKEISYKYEKVINLGTETSSDNKKRCIRITLDDRGFLACLILNNNDGGTGKSKIIMKDVNDVTEFPFEMIKREVRLNSIFFNLSLKKDYFESFQLNTNLPNVGRFRFFLNRLNKSVNAEAKPKYKQTGIVISPEYKIEYKFNPKTQKLDKTKILKDYTMKDELRPGATDNYWALKFGDYEEKIPVDLIDENISKNNIRVAEFTKYLDTEKQYRQVEVDGNKNLILNSVEDWVEQSMYPNTSYSYELGFYNYQKILRLNSKSSDGGTVTPEIYEETTMPLGVPSKMISRVFEIDDKGNLSISLSFKYGNLSQLHFETQKFNPLYCYLFRKEHNRDRNVSTKYITLKAKQWIQIIVPADSKYIFSKFSKPKFGKLYLFNAYAKNSPEGQNVKMEIGKYYREDYQIIYYSAEGGEYKDGGIDLPDPEELGENPFVDDFFTLGDNPSSTHKQIKFRVRINLEEIKEGIDEKYVHFTDPETIGDVLKNYNKDRKVNEHSMVLVKKEPLFDKDYNYKSEISIKDIGTKTVPISYNKTYEYFVMIGNHKKINSGVNSFYVTTKPSKPLFNRKGLEKIKLVENGQRKNYLKIEWFTPKNENIYWPFNFLVCRRVNKEEPVEPLKIADSTQQKNPDFSNQNNLIRMIEPKDAGPKTLKYKYYHQVFKHDIGDWKVSFVVYGNYQGQTFKILKDSGMIEIAKGKSYEDFVKEIDIKMKYFDHGKNKIIEEKWVDWTSTKNMKRLPNVSSIELFIPLAKGFTLTKMEVAETVIIPENTSTLSKYELAKKMKRKEEEEKIEQDLLKIEKEKLKEKNRLIQKKKQLGQVFLLGDDYEDTQKSNYGGYGGELYRFLKDKPKLELLKIFDRLHQNLLINHGDVTMKMEGPSGMLRSGNRDMLIDKIRYMSMILRKNHDEALDSIGLTCDSSSVAKMFDNQEDLVNPQKKCFTKQEMALREKKKVMEKKKIEMEQMKNLVRMQQEALQQEVENLRAEMERADAARKAQLQKEINQLDKLKKEEEEKLKKNADLIEQEKEFKKLEAETVQMDEELSKSQVLPAGIKEFTKKGTYLEPFRDALKIEKVILNKMYIGNYGGFYGEKMRVDLKTFLTDLRTGITTRADIRNNFKTMSNIIYDFNKRELFFVLPGEKVKENLGNLVDAPNHVVIFFGEERKTPAQLAKEKEGIAKMSDKRLQDINKEIEAKKKLLLQKGMSLADLKFDVDLSRLQELQNTINKNKSVGISEWSFIKQGKPELFISIYPEEDEIKKVLEDYAVTPTLASLSSRIGLGGQFFEEGEISKEEAEREYISHHQLIELSQADSTPYEYCIGTFQTGFSFNSEDKKSFMGMDYITDILNEEEIKESSKNQMPLLHHGGSYSQIVSTGTPIKNTKPTPKPEIMEASLSPAPDSIEPVIKFFSPKEGLQGSIVKIVGQKLDEIEYFCFRDVKAEILQKTKTFILEGEGEEKEKVVYDMVLLKVPTLKQLGKECWQSLRPYEALVWGYYKMGGKQIRTSEVQDITDEDKGRDIHRKLMFRYLDRTQCPEGQKLEIPK